MECKSILTYQRCYKAVNRLIFRLLAVIIWVFRELWNLETQHPNFMYGPLDISLEIIAVHDNLKLKP